MHNAYHHGVQRRGQRVLKGGAWDASRQTLNIFGGRSPEKWGAAPPPSEQTEWGGAEVVGPNVVSTISWTDFVAFSYDA